MTQLKTSDAARGRWREILLALGVEAKLLTGQHQPCPLCGGKDRFRFTDVTGAGDYFCNGCGSGPGLMLLQKLRGLDFKAAADQVDAVIGRLPQRALVRIKPGEEHRKQRAVRELWAAAQPIEDGDPVARYLKGRGLHGPYSNRLRYHPACFHKPTEQEHPAMLALFEGATKAQPNSLHRTYLTVAGAKFDHDQAKMFMPGALPKGGAMRLGKAAEKLGIAEGIETAMSAARLFQMPVWAAGNAGNLERWQPPPEAQHVFIFGDNDRETFAGQAAAYALARRLGNESRRRIVAVKIPSAQKDWNDVLRGDVHA
jgi:putative DNA primase/helicase